MTASDFAPALTAAKQETVTVTAAITSSTVQVVALAAFPPSSPTNEQQIILELPSTYDPVGGKVVRWHVVYNSTDGVWDFIGGPDLEAEIDTAQGTASLVYADLGTVGPSVTVPRGGDYDVWVATDLQQNTAIDGAFASYAVGAAAAADADSVSATISGTNIFSAAKGPRRKTGLAALAAITMKYRASNGGTATFQNRRLCVRPVRIT